MADPAKEASVEKKEGAAAPAEEAATVAKEGDTTPAPDAAAPAKHDDEQQDIELIKKMIAEYLGDDAKEAPEAMQMATEALGCYREMGYSEEEAMKCAGHSMKLAKHLGEKKAKQEAMEAEAKEAAAKAEAAKEAMTPSAEEESKKEAADAPASEKKESDVKEAAVEEKKESAPAKEAAEVARLAGENAKLRETIAKRELADHLEKTLRESGLPMSATKSFRKLVEGAKNQKEIDEKFSSFKEAFVSAAGAGEGSSSGFAFAVEKSVGSAGGGTGSGFSDCVN